MALQTRIYKSVSQGTSHMIMIDQNSRLKTMKSRSQSQFGGLFLDMRQIEVVINHSVKLMLQN